MNHGAMRSPRRVSVTDVTEDVQKRLQKVLLMLDPSSESEALNADLGCAAPVTEARVRRELRARRTRDQFFQSSLFADPAWDMLLELYASHIGQTRVSVSSLCIAAAVPGTTALRWISALEKQGLLYRRPDPMDGRRVFIGLSDEARSSMDSYFASLKATEDRVIRYSDCRMAR